MKIQYFWLVFIYLCLITESIQKINEKSSKFVTKNFLKALHKQRKFLKKQKINHQFKKHQNRIPPERALKFKDAWASSQFHYKVWWSEISYPAENPLKGKLWMSQFMGLDSKTQVTWEGTLEQYHLVEALSIFWKFAPGECEIQTSPDGGDQWQVQFPMQNCRWDPIKEHGLTRFEMWRYSSFQKRFLFPTPAFAKKIRIIMKEAIFGYYGIERVVPLIRGLGYAFQFKSKHEKDGQICISIMNGDFAIGTSVIAQDCTSAILNADGRELFIFNSETQQIYSMIGELCFSVNTNFMEVQLTECHPTASNRFSILSNGKIKSKMMSDKCLAKNKEEISIADLNFESSASSSMWGGQHTPDQVFQSKDTFWKSLPGKQENIFEVIFDSVPIQSIKIEWVQGFEASSYKVLVLSDNHWKTVFNNMLEENQQSISINEIQLDSFSYNGIKIIMNDGKGVEQDGSEKKIAYAIQEIYIKTQIYRIIFEDCNEEKDELKWELFDINFVDASQSAILKSQRKFMMADYDNLISNILKIKEFKEINIPQLDKNRHEIQKQLDDIEDELDDISKQSQKFNSTIIENIIESEVKTVKQKSGIEGSSNLQPAKSCVDLKKKFSYKRSGYYWIKNDCNEFPVRLFCDFENNSSYMYVGATQNIEILSDDYSSPQDLRNQCIAVGLEPLALQSIEQLKMIEKLLLDNSVSMNDEQYIPILHDYKCNHDTCDGKFASFNSINSVSFNQELAPLMGANWWQEYINDSYDSLALNYNLKLKFVKVQKDLKIKGIICSNNYDENFDKFLELQCDTTMNLNTDFDGDGVGTRYNVKCPENCLQKGQASRVYGSQGVYKDDSSICLAAIHSGIMIEKEGGKFIIAIDQNRLIFDGSTNFEVRSQEFTSNDQPIRSFNIQEFTTICPQGINYSF